MELSGRHGKVQGSNPPGCARGAQRTLGKGQLHRRMGTAGKGFSRRPAPPRPALPILLLLEGQQPSDTRVLSSSSIHPTNLV